MTLCTLRRGGRIVIVEPFGTINETLISVIAFIMFRVFVTKKTIYIFFFCTGFATTVAILTFVI